MCRGFALVVAIVALLSTAQALTDQEIQALLTNHNSSDFIIELLPDPIVIRVTISGRPEHLTGTCYNTSLGCCRPNVVIRPRTKTFDIPRYASAGTTTYCTPQGTVGVTTGGTVFYNMFERNCMNIALLPPGSFDFCNGHPSPQGEYHFHKAPAPGCIASLDRTNPKIIGISLDGFAIYDSSFYNGFYQTLDECGGFMPDGINSRYRYVATSDKVIGCYRGLPLNPRCCSCKECGRQQLPNCTSGRGDRRPVGGDRNNIGNQNPVNDNKRPNVESQNSVGTTSDRFCTRDQLQKLRPNRNQPSQSECNDCPACVTDGGFTFVDAQKYEKCQRCSSSKQMEGIQGRGPRGGGRGGPRGGQGGPRGGQGGVSGGMQNGGFGSWFNQLPPWARNFFQTG